MPTDSMPRVTINEGMRSRVCRRPLISPISVATPTAARIPRMPMLKFGPSFSAPVSGLMLATVRAAITELNAMIPSTDRSIPPIMITREMPSADISRIALCLARPARFVGLRKRGVMRVITMHSPIRMSSGPTTAGMRRSRPTTPCRGVVVVVVDATWLHSCADNCRPRVITYSSCRPLSPRPSARCRSNHGDHRAHGDFRK